MAKLNSEKLKNHLLRMLVEVLCLFTSRECEKEGIIQFPHIFPLNFIHDRGKPNKQTNNPFELTSKTIPPKETATEANRVQIVDQSQMCIFFLISLMLN